MKKDTNIFIQHILESIERIEEFTKQLSQKDFMNSIQAQDAVIRRLEIIGEATKNIPAAFRNKHSQVPWSKLAKMRDKLIHGYFGVDIVLTWDIVKKDLPSLKVKIKGCLIVETER